MTNEAFAAHLGVAVRTVSKWREQPTLVQTAQMQAMLDTCVHLADGGARLRFEQLLSSAEPTAHNAGNSERKLGTARSQSTEGLIMMIAEESACHGRLSVASNVGENELGWLEAALDRVAVDLLTGPLIPLVQEMRQIRDQTFTALQGRQYPRQSRRLYTVGARVCGLLAVVTADRFGVYDAAARHARTAAIAADLADESAILAWTASLESTIAFWQGRYRTAAVIAQEARSEAPDGAEPARLAAFEARAWAKVGNRDSMNTALDVARRARELDGPVAGTGAMAYPLSDQVRMAGTAHLWIGDTDQARLELEDALILLGDEYNSVPHVAATHADLALAHLQSDDLDEAATALTPLLSMTNTHLAGASRRATALVQTLRRPRYADSRVAQQLVADIQAFVAEQNDGGEVAGAVGTARLS